MRKFIAHKIYVLLLVIFFASNVFAASQQTSSTTAQTVIDNARVYLNETSEDDFWDDTELLQFLNDGMVDIVAITHCLQTTESVSLVADTIEYSITSTYATVTAVQYTDASSDVYALRRGSPDHVGSDEVSRMNLEKPTYWYDWAGKIGIYPSLSSVTTETVTLYIITRPTEITVSDNVTIPALYDKALTLYIVAQAFLKDRQTARYAQIMGMYYQELTSKRQDLTEIIQMQAVDTE